MDENRSEDAPCARPADGIAKLVIELDCRSRMRGRGLIVSAEVCLDGGLLQQDRALAAVRSDPEGLVQVSDRLLMAAERRRALRGAAQRHAGLGRNRVRLGSRGRRVVCREVVRRQDSCQLVAGGGLEVPRSGEVTLAALRPREGRVSHFLDQRLYERVLAALRRPRIPLHGENFSSHESTKAGLEFLRVPVHECGQRFQAEGMAKHGCVLDQ